MGKLLVSRVLVGMRGSGNVRWNLKRLIIRDFYNYFLIREVEYVRMIFNLIGF
jgi:hypothetical protein